MRSKKKAFTLTELLIVVIVIGVLAAIVLPKFNKVIETRKTTEAEELMTAVRTEQEHRCTIGGNYAGSFAQMGEVTSSLDDQGKSKYYQYNVGGSEISAQSLGSDYVLRMPSFADGRICCDGNGCDRLNKDYPSCDTFVIAGADSQVDAACAPLQSCSGAATQACGCNNSGIQTRQCDTTTGTWGPWSACEGTSCSCQPDGDGMNTTRDYGCNGVETRTCDHTTGQWSAWTITSPDTQPQTRTVNYTPQNKCPANCASKIETQTCVNKAWEWTGSYSNLDETNCNSAQNKPPYTDCPTGQGGRSCTWNVSTCNYSCSGSCTDNACWRCVSDASVVIGSSTYDTSDGQQFSFYYAAQYCESNCIVSRTRPTGSLSGKTCTSWEFVGYIYGGNCYQHFPTWCASKLC